LESQVFAHGVKPGFWLFGRIRWFTAGDCSILSLFRAFIYVNGRLIHIGVFGNLWVSPL